MLFFTDAELKRYFEAAEAAAKEILLEEIKPKLAAGNLHPAGDQELLEQLQVTRSAEVNENDGVFQLTTIGSLPLKSPKRMVALQLANSNPAFRERFREKLEASGGVTYQISDLSKQSSGSNRKSQKGLQAFGGKGGFMPGYPGGMTSLDMPGGYMLDGSFPGGGSGNITLSSTNSAFFPETSPTGILHHGNYPRSSNGGNGATVTFSDLPTPVMEYLTGITDHFGGKADFHSGADSSLGKGKGKALKPKKEKKEKTSKRDRDLDDADSPERNNDGNDVPSSTEIKKRGRKPKADKQAAQTSSQHFDDAADVQDGKGARKRRKNSRYDDEEEQEYLHSSSSLGGDASSTGGSIIKRRRKGELQIMVDGGAGLTAGGYQALHSSDNRYANGLHSLAGGVLSAMGPPDDTPRRSFRMRSTTAAAAAAHQGLGSLGGYGGYGNYMESPFNPDIFSVFIDTPSNLAHGDPLLSSKPNTGTAADAMRFDFDEVAAHFPSPRAGEQLKGSSPSRWSGGSTTSINSGFFNFPDPSLMKDGMPEEGFARKGKKSKRESRQRDSAESGISVFSEMSAISGLAALSEDHGDIGFSKAVVYPHHDNHEDDEINISLSASATKAPQDGPTSSGSKGKAGSSESKLNNSLLVDSPSLYDVGVGGSFESTNIEVRLSSIVSVSFDSHNVDSIYQ